MKRKIIDRERKGIREMSQKFEPFVNLIISYN